MIEKATGIPIINKKVVIKDNQNQWCSDIESELEKNIETIRTTDSLPRGTLFKNTETRHQHARRIPNTRIDTESLVWRRNSNLKKDTL